MIDDLLDSSNVLIGLIWSGRRGSERVARLLTPNPTPELATEAAMNVDVSMRIRPRLSEPTEPSLLGKSRPWTPKTLTPSEPSADTKSAH